MQPPQRIDLEDNDLAAATMQTVDRIRPHFRSIAAVIGLLFAGLALWTALSGQQAATRGASWRAGLTAARDGNPAALAEVARLYPGTPAADWADLTAADMAFEEGVDLLFTDRGQATKRLEEAANRYERLMQGRVGRIVAERAVFGLAKTNESLGKLTEARQGYEAVARDYADGACAGVAATRAAALARPAASEWYAWFAAQDFAALDKPQEPATPPANATPESPGKPATEPAAGAGTGAEPRTDTGPAAKPAAQPEPGTEPATK